MPPGLHSPPPNPAPPHPTPSPGGDDNCATVLALATLLISSPVVFAMSRTASWIM